MLKFLFSLFRREYQYSALPQGSVFRYLVLKPGQGDDTLECSIHIHTLDEPPDYEAVSYVWGPPTQNQIILCDGQVLKITQSLSNVLKRLRLRSEPRALWADSICINQKDLNEKGHQVVRMAQIYRSAKRTLICLGDEQDMHAKAAVELIEEINERIVRACRRNDEPWAIFPYLDPEDPILSNTRWKSLSLLYNSAWFSRGWTVQEAALSQQSLAIWGQYEVEWAKLMRVDVWANWRAPCCAQTYNVRSPALHWHLYFHQYQHEARFFWEEKHLPTIGLLTILESARPLVLSDPRDRLYAFLGLPISNEEDGLGTILKLQPRYDQEFLDVYKSFAIYYIQEKQEVGLLDYVQHTQQTLDTTLPSWIPRWDIELEGGSRLYFPLWQTLTDRISSVHIPLVTGTELGVRAVILDSIIYVSEVMRLPKMTLDDISNIWKAVAQIDIPTPYPPARRLHAFTETLYGDILPVNVETFQRSQAAYLLELHRRTSEGEAVEYHYWEEIAEGGHMSIYQSLIQLLLRGKRLFLTQRGYFGVAYDVVRGGDQCGIIFGCKTPSVLRHTGTINRYRLLGGAYITGSTLQNDQGKFQRFTLLGRKESKDWIEWEVQEDNIILC